MIVASLCPWRLFLLASISFSTSLGVRYSLVRRADWTSALVPSTFRPLAGLISGSVLLAFVPPMASNIPQCTLFVECLRGDCSLMVKKKPVTIAGSGSCIEVKQHSVMIEQALNRLQRLSVRRQGAYNAIIMKARDWTMTLTLAAHIAEHS